MTEENVAEAEAAEQSEPRPARLVDDRLIDEPVSRARAEGRWPAGEGGLLRQSTQRLPESAPEDERVVFLSATDLTAGDVHAHFAEVEVDAVTGEVRVSRLLGAFAAGRILTPRTARSHFLGGMTTGIGMALTY
ncbi:molybdopterin cofactor-binding domain-containing protein [Streptomyces roseolus]|uniref:cadherin repeat domain-containing protein n=1 Tax=Streptomyces roseolus TaxID=67358 RepID=UPI0037967B4C